MGDRAHSLPRVQNAKMFLKRKLRLDHPYSVDRKKSQCLRRAAAVSIHPVGKCLAPFPYLDIGLGRSVME